MTTPIRIGAVRYLNSKPLIYRLDELAPHVQLVLDVPSRLADGLAAGALDVALIPSIEYFRGRVGKGDGSLLCEAPAGPFRQKTPVPFSNADYSIVPDIAIAAHGPVLSVKLYCRVPMGRVRSVALDEGSRTSVALTSILFERRHGLRPERRPLPLGQPAEESDADAVLVIGDRAIRPLELGQVETYDLGEEWLKETGLPFVFAMWVARGGVDLGEVAPALRRAKRLGTSCVREIADREGPPLGLSSDDCHRYLTEFIRFDLGPRELQGLKLFYDSCVAMKLAHPGVPFAFYGQPDLAEVR
jgi:chorismate dehydratase